VRAAAAEPSPTAMRSSASANHQRPPRSWAWSSRRSLTPLPPGGVPAGIIRRPQAEPRPEPPVMDGPSAPRRRRAAHRARRHDPAAGGGGQASAATVPDDGRKRSPPPGQRAEHDHLRIEEVDELGDPRPRTVADRVITLRAPGRRPGSSTSSGVAIDPGQRPGTGAGQAAGCPPRWRTPPRPGLAVGARSARRHPPVADLAARSWPADQAPARQDAQPRPVPA